MNTEKLATARKRVQKILTEGTYEERMMYFYEFLSKQIETIVFFGTTRFRFKDIMLLRLVKIPDNLPNELDTAQEIEERRHRAVSFEELVTVDNKEYVGLVTFLELCHEFVSDFHYADNQELSVFIEKMKRNEQQKFLEENQFAFENIIDGAKK